MQPTGSNLVTLSLMFRNKLRVLEIALGKKHPEQAAWCALKLSTASRSQGNPAVVTPPCASGPEEGTPTDMQHYKPIELHIGFLSYAHSGFLKTGT
jgi:hypothetical protein